VTFELEILLMWVAMTFYVASTAMYAFAVTFVKERLGQWALYAAAGGLAFQTISLGIRWARLGHGPYLGFYEVANALVFCVVAFFVVTALRSPRLNSAGIGIMPVAVLLLGGSMLASKSGLPITPKLASYWLFVHVAFANLAFAAFSVSFGCAIIYVIRERSAGEGWSRRLERLPAQDVLENLTVRFVLVGFLFWGIMIATGAIWANEAWGRYWSWDPIETWSLIVWIIYAVYLHVRFTMKWSGERLAWFAIVAMPLALFALIGIPLAFKTPHAGIGGLGKDL
jgi:cytochrome c-type biogenesis protein CcsB